NRITSEPGLLDARAQREPALELDHDLRLPRRRLRGRVIHVEIVLVLPCLDEELEVSVLPTHATPARPDAQGAVLEKVLVPFSREAQIGFGALAHAESAGEQAHRVLVDFGRADLKAGILLGRFVHDAGRRRVAEVLILRAHDRGHDLSGACAALAADAPDWG